MFSNVSDLFPDPRTLNKHLENYKCGPGPQEDAFHLLKMKESLFSEKGRYVVIKFDEIHLKEKMEYDPTNKCLSGTITMPLHSDPTRYEGKHCCPECDFTDKVLFSIHFVSYT